MNIEIANRLIDLRKKNGYSQEELAEKIGISRQAISKWERAESSPDTDNLIVLSRLYNISLDELIYADESEEQPEIDTADESTDSDIADGQKITLKYKRSGLQKNTMLFSADFVIDGKKTVRVAPDTSAESYLEVGSHKIRASISLQNNEGFVVATQVEIKPDAAYEITYSVSSFTMAGVISVSESSPDDISGKKSVTTVTKGRKGFMIIVMMIMVFVFTLGTFAPSLFRGKAATVSDLNTPCTNAGLKIIATEIKAINHDGKSVIAVNFEVENVSGKEIFFQNSEDLTYIDNVKAKSAYGDNSLDYGDLSAGKKISGYLYYFLPEDAKEIEIKFEVELKEKFVFILNIPSKGITESNSEFSVNNDASSVVSNTGKEIVVTKLNTPGINAGMKMTATEIKIVKPEYDTRSLVAVYFEAENQSGEKVNILLPSAYADGKKVDFHIYGDQNFNTGYLDSGKRTAGYLFHFIPVNAKKIELKFDVGLSRGLSDTYITFTLDIPH